MQNRSPEFKWNFLAALLATDENLLWGFWFWQMNAGGFYQLSEDLAMIQTMDFFSSYGQWSHAVRSNGSNAMSDVFAWVERMTAMICMLAEEQR